MKKIIYIITQSELGGAQENVLDLAAGLREKYDVLVAAGPDGGGKLFKQLADNKISFQELKWLRRSAANPFADIAGLVEIFSLLLKERPDVIHLHSSKAGFLGSLAGKLAGVKVVYTVHGAVFEASFSGLARKFFLYLEKFSAPFKDKIICVSANDKKLWLKYNAAPETKLAIVYNGIDLKTAFLPKAEAKEYLASQSANFFEALRGSNEKLRIVGTVANFFPEKGLPYLIEAADVLINKKQIKNIIFAIMGEGPQRLLLKEMLEERGLADKFILLGTVANPFKYLKAFDVFTQPSTKEGLPYAILWAMAAELPIVASHVGGIPEMVKNGDNGFLIFPRDTDTLAEKILELLSNHALSQKFTFNSRQKIREFSLDKMIAATEKIYLEK
ncbi:MAG: glycosyltransferase family 4 protein [Candidatus Portnoybacteria bacterium]|nr:glycosyltransferase family 4 protein [Candidatus Portnoybacteria bacterium]MDD4982509.1 glycosyltransferase family 4 protein [Candidatus Portnoybacteria bacterium]